MMFARSGAIVPALLLAALCISRTVHAAYAQQGAKLVGTGNVGTAFQGRGVAISADGTTLIEGGASDNSNVGAAWVFTRSGGVWTQQQKLVGTGNVGAALQGLSVALSGDGNTALIGGSSDNVSVGATWVFTRSGGVWTQQGAKLVGTGSTGASQQGYSVSISDDGNTALIGGYGNNGDNGASWVFTRTGGVWTQQGAMLLGTGGVGFSRQGSSVSLSSDGNTALIGGYADNNTIGAAWVFTRNGGTWTQQGAKLVGTGFFSPSPGQGIGVSLSSDGNTALIGSYSGGVGSDVGASWVFTRSAGVWTQQGAKLVGTGNVGNSNQGYSVSLSADGNTAFIGGPGDNSSAGAAWVFARSGGVWTQQGAKLVGTGSIGGANLGFFNGTALSRDGTTAVVGGYLDNSAQGAVWVFALDPKLTATLAASPSSLMPGGTINYTVKVSNIDTVTKTGTAFNLTLDPNTTLNAGTLNSSPYTIDQTVTATAGVALPITMAAVDPDVGETATLVYSINVQPQHGTLGAVSGTGVTYTATAGYSGSDSFTFKAKDVHGVFSNEDGVVSIVVTLPAPIAVNDPNYQAGKGTPLTVAAAQGVLANDTVNFATIVSFGASTGTEQTTLGANASTLQGNSVSLNANGSFGYAPAPNFVGADSFKYKLSNSSGSSTATVTITVLAPPVAATDGISPPYATPVGQQFVQTAPGVLGNDTLNGATLSSYGASTGSEQTTIGTATPTAQGGSIVLNADGSFTFTPKAGFSGNDTFKYTITNVAASSTATVTIACTLPPPVAVADPNYLAGKNTPLTIAAAQGVLGNDTLNGATIASFGASTGNEQTTLGANTPTAQSGSVSLNSDGSFGYAPVPNFIGTDTFKYKLSNNGGSSIATVTITVLAPPVAVADPATGVTWATPVGNQFGRTAGSGVLANDTLNSATITSYGATTGLEQTTIGTATPTAQGGSIVVQSTGAFTFTPKAGFSGNDTFKYTITNIAGSSTATATIYCDVLPTVTGTSPLNNATGTNIQAPVTITFSEQITTTAAFAFTDTTASSSVAFAQSPTDGNPGTTFTLTPSSNLTPGHSYTVTVLHNQTADVDGGLSMPAPDYTFSFTTLPLPSALNDPDTQGGRYQVTANIPIDTSLTATPSSVLDNDTLNGGALSTYGPTGPTASTPIDGTSTISSQQGGTVLMRTNGTFTYTPKPGFTGTDAFFYKLHNASVVFPTPDPQAQVLINVTGPVVWFVNNTVASSGNGTLSSPFKDLTNITNDGAALHPAAGAVFFIYNSATAYTGPITLLNTQSMIGQAAAGTFASLTGVTATTYSVALPATGTGTKPTIGTGAIFPASNNVINSFTLSPTTTSGIILNTDIGSTGSVTNVDIASTSTGSAVSSNATFVGTLNYTTGTITSSGSNNVINLLGASSGSMTFSNVSVSNTGSASTLNVNAHTGGSITFSGTSSLGSTGASTGLAVAVTNCANTTVNLGAINLQPTGAGATGLSLTGNSGTTAVNAASGTIIVSGSAITVSGVNALTLPLGTVTSTGGANGINIGAGTSGSITATGGALSGAVGVEFNVTGGTCSITYPGNITGGNGQHSVNISGATGGTIALSGSVTENAAGAGISLTNNTGATINFSGTITASTGAATAFTATGGGTISATGANSALTTTTGTALNVANTTIGAGGLTFKSINSTTAGGNSGIVLNTTGSSGGLTVTGTGTTAGSGGTISNKTVAGISLTSTTNVSLSNMNVQANSLEGIIGTSVNGFSMTGCSVTGNSTAANNRDGIKLTDTTGAVSFVNDTVTGNFNSNVQLTTSPSSTAVMTTLTVTNGTYSSSTQNAGFLVDLHGSPSLLTASVNGATFSGNFSKGIQFQHNDNATMGNGVGAPATGTITVNNCTFTNNDVAASFESGGTGGNGSAYYRFTNNATIIGSHSLAVNFANGSTVGTGTFKVFCDNNHIGTNNVPNSGAAIGEGIRVFMQGRQTATATITNNVIRALYNGAGGFDARGIDVEELGSSNTGQGPTSLDVKITGNDVDQQYTGASFNNQYAIYVAADGQASGSGSNVRAEIHDNIVPTQVASDSSPCGGTGGCAMIWIETVSNANNPAAALYNAFGDASVNAAIINHNTGLAGKTQATQSGAGQPAVTLTGTPPNTVALMYAPGGVEAANAVAQHVVPISVGDDTPVLDPQIAANPCPCAEQKKAAAAARTAAIENAKHRGENSNTLTQIQLDKLVFAARAQWEATGLSATQRAVLQEVKFEVANLGPWRLGEAGNGVIRVDANAGGHGWYIEGEEGGGRGEEKGQFPNVLSSTRFYTTPEKAPAGRIDLLTTIMHEMGHALGLPDEYDARARDSIMYGYLTKGERRLPAKGDLIQNSKFKIQNGQRGATDPGGVKEGSRGLSKAIPPDSEERTNSTPEGSQRNSRGRRESSATPLESIEILAGQSGGIALRAQPPATLCDPSGVGPERSTAPWRPAALIVALAGISLLWRSRRAAALAFVAAMSLASSAQAATTVSVPTNLAGTRGSPLSVPVSVSNGAGITDATIVLSLDGTVFSLSGVTVNAALSGASFTGSSSGSNPIQITLTFHSSTPLAAGSVTLGNVNLNVLPPAPSGTSALHFTSSSLNGGAIASATSDGSVILGLFENIGNLPPGKSTTITFTATVANPTTPSNAPTVSQQGQITATNITGTVFTDDPNTPATLGDPTVTTIVHAPTIATITAPANGSYRAGQNLDFTLNWTSAVNVAGGVPSFGIVIGTTTKNATYISGTGTTATLFRYTILAGDNDSDGIALVSPVALNGATIVDANNSNAAVLTFTPPNTTGVLVDTTAPTIASVTPPANGSYRAGQNLDFTVNFSEVVAVNIGGGAPTLSLTVGATARNALYISGSGSTGLLFRYIVQAGENDSDGVALTSPLALNGATITDVAGNAALLTFTPPATNGVVVDTIGPSITGVIPPSNKTYGAPQNLDFTVNFNETAVVNTGSGTPGITLTVGSNLRTAAYVSGSGTSSLVFRYTTQANEVDSDGIACASPIILNGGTIQDVAGNNAALAFAVPNTSGVLVDGVAPVITAIADPGNMYFGLGQTIPCVLTFTKPVTVIGSPQLNLTVGTTTRSASLVSGSGTATLTFQYTVQAGDQDNDGIDMLFPIVLNGGSIKDGVGNNAVLTFQSNTENFQLTRVDGIVPTITSLTPPANGIYHLGQNLDFTMNFSEQIADNTFGGTKFSYILITIGSTVRQANQVPNVSGVIFRYTVQASDNDVDGITVSSPLVLNGASIVDQASNNLVLTFTPPDTTGVKVDGGVPAILTVIAPANGTYIAGQNLDFTVNYSESVNVTGSPSIPLTIGAASRNAVFVSGTGTPALLFRYTVQPGDNDSDGIVASSPLALNGGTISDGFNNAGLTFTPPNSNAVLVDTTPPTIVSVTPPANKTYIVGDNVDWTINFSEPVNVVITGGSPRMSIFFGSSTKNANYIQGSGTNALLFRYTVLAGDFGPDGVAINSPLNLNGGTIKDAAGNDSTLTFVSTSLPNQIAIDGVAPTITSVAPPANATYVAGQNLDFSVNFSENVAVSGTPQLSLVVGATARTANYVSGTGSAALLFRYTVQPGESDTDGVALSSPVALNGGTIKDIPGNAAVLTFTPPNTAGVLVDAIPPTIASVTPPAIGSYRATINLNFTLTFNEAVTVNTVGGTPSLSLTIGAAAKNATYVSGSGTTALSFRYTIVAGDNAPAGIVVNSPLALNGGTIQDGAGNNAVLTFSAPTTSGVIVDTTPPTIVSVTPPANGSYRAGQNLDFTIAFSENVLVAGGVPSLSLSIGAASKNAAYVSGSGTSSLLFRYTIAAGDTAAAGIALTSPIALNGATMQDIAGNSLVLTFTPPNTTGVLVDTTPPTVLSIVRADSNPSNAATVRFTVNFSKSVSGVDNGDFALVQSGVAGASIANVSGSGSGPYTVTVNTGSGDGTLGLNLTNNSSIVDPAGNTLSEVQTVTITGASGSFTLSFNGSAPTGPLAFNASAAQVQASLNALSTIGGVGGFVLVNLSGGVYTIEFAGSLAGTNVPQLQATGIGGANATPGTIADGGTFAGQVYTIDKTPPSTQISAPSVTITKGGPVVYTITYSDANFNASTLSQANVSLNATAGVNVGSVQVTGSGLTRTVTLNSISGDGTLGISVVAGTASDTAGNLAPAAGPSATFIVDNTPPSAQIGAPSVTNTLHGPVSWTVTYSDANFNSSTLASGNLTLNASPGINVGTISVTGSGTTRTVTLDNITGFGTLGFSIAANTATDLAGNAALGAGPSQTVQVNSPPTITGTLANQAVNDNATIQPFSGVTIADVDTPPQTLSVTFTLDDPAKGTITSLNGFTNAGGGLYTFSGIATAATTAIQGVVFTPTPNRLPVGNAETLNIALTATDNFSPVVNDNTTSVVITSVNDAPSNVQTVPSLSSIKENDSITLLGTFVDPDPQDTHTVSIDWGDGTAASVQQLAAGAFSFSAPHQYLNNPAGQPQGSFTIKATVTDASNASGSGTASVQVNNVAPKVTINGAPVASVEPGNAIALTSAVTDPGTLDTFTYAWAVTKNGAPFSTGTSASFSFTPDTDATYAVSLTVTDSDGGTGSASVTIAVDTVPSFLSGPAANPNPAVVDLAVAFSVTTRPAGAIVTWDFGDGTPSAAGANVSHIYTAAGNYTVTVSAKNPRTATTTAATLALTVGGGSTIPTTLPTLFTRGIVAFNPNGDRVTLLSAFQLQPGQAIAGQTLTISINGLTRTFMLDAHGNAVSADGRIHLRGLHFTLKGATGRLSLNLKGNLKPDLSSGVTVDAAGNPVKAVVEFTLGTNVYSFITPLQFKHSAARFGFH